MALARPAGALAPRIYPATLYPGKSEDARTAWAVLAKGETYRTPTRSNNAAIAAAA